MKKDLQSFKEHEQDYLKLHTHEYVQNILKKQENEKMYEKLGFEQAINKLSVFNTHVDVGCGSGWLLYKTQPLFKRLIGIEPVKEIIEINKQIIDEKGGIFNIEFINMDMVDGMEKLNLQEPTFVTTSTVLSHMQDYYVAEFLKTINKLPEGSNLFFDERYDKNIQQNMWHIRNKNWWAKNLPDWQLEFFGLDNMGYKSGIFGVKVKKGTKINYFYLTEIEKIKWFIDGLKNKVNRIIRFITNKIK